MGFFTRFRKPSYVGVSAAELGTDLEPLLRRLAARLRAEDPVIQLMGPMLVCRSPVLVLRGRALVQPASLVPVAMLGRFYGPPATEFLDDPMLLPVIAGYARALAANPEFARGILVDTEQLWVSDDAPAMPWPDTDPRLRLCSLVLADVMRKLSADFSPAEIRASYGLAPAYAPAARQRAVEMRQQEAHWISAAIAASQA